MRMLGIITIVILSIAIIAVIVFVALDSDSWRPVDNGIAYITFGNGREAVIRVGDYKRVSQGWIVIKSTDGTTYGTNDKNVLLMKTPQK